MKNGANALAGKVKTVPMGIRANEGAAVRIPDMGGVRRGVFLAGCGVPLPRGKAPSRRHAAVTPTRKRDAGLAATGGGVLSGTERAGRCAQEIRLETSTARLSNSFLSNPRADSLSSAL